MPRRRHVLIFANGPAHRVSAMQEELARLLPAYEHHIIHDGSWLELIERFPPFSIAHTAALLGPDTDARLRWIALALAPTRMLAYDVRGDRFHLHPQQPLASLLFWSGHPVSRIHWRPWRDESIHHNEIHQFTGAPASPAKPQVAILSPYLPWPLSHGGAVRIYSLLREGARHANLHLYAFLEEGEAPDPGPLADLCTRITLVRKPRYGRWDWASFRPAAVHEFDTPAMRKAWSECPAGLKQVEFTQLAGYPGDILIEHDITMDLAAQELARTGSLVAQWNHWRWRHFETRALRRFRAIAVMSEKDRGQVQHPRIAVLPNGVDLQRFSPQAEKEEPNLLLFIGSFRHFPNVLAYQFLVNEVWPLLRQTNREVRLIAVAGPNPELYYPDRGVPQPEGVELRAFEPRVEDLYARATVVLIPTPVSAGTNIKALEAMACGKAILSTPSGVNGLPLAHGKEVFLALDAQTFASAASCLLKDPALRQRLGSAAREKAEAEFSWQSIGAKQWDLWRSLLLK
jgi:glycosyltransferase involved in cell wall biosynthesis